MRHMTQGHVRDMKTIIGFSHTGCDKIRHSVRHRCQLVAMWGRSANRTSIYCMTSSLSYTDVHPSTQSTSIKVPV